MGKEVWGGGAPQGCPQCERGLGLEAPKDGNGLEKMSVTPPSGLRSALGMSPEGPSRGGLSLLIYQMGE